MTFDTFKVIVQKRFPKTKFDFREVENFYKAANDHGVIRCGPWGKGLTWKWDFTPVNGATFITVEVDLDSAIVAATRRHGRATRSLHSLGVDRPQTAEFW